MRKFFMCLSNFLAGVVIIVAFAISGVQKDEATELKSKEAVSSANSTEITKIYACGRLAGIYEQTKGVLVVDIARVEDENGKMHSPAKSKIKCGDYIIKIDEKTVNNKTELSDTVNEIMKTGEKKSLNITLERENEIKSVSVKPVKASDGRYYMGVWAKDDLAGIGTITFYRPDGSFGALGHGIGDGTDSGKLLNADKGDLYRMELTKIKKGERGTPGELGGIVYFGRKSHLGTLEDNNELGIYGTLDSEELNEYSMEDKLYPIAKKTEIKKGPAKIISEISGELKMYEIEITDIDLSEQDSNKGLVIKVIDEELIQLTGGIVQGTSGSPIIQDGKIVGAVTHVFVDNPKMGYGIFIENMLQA